MEAFDYKFDLPKDWEDQSVYVFLGPTEDNYEHRLMLAIDRHLQHDNVDKFACQQTSIIRENLQGLEVLKDAEITEEEWDKERKEPTRNHILQEMQDYLSFAYEKARGGRGISACRSMAHYTAWIWLLNEEDTEEHFGNLMEYDRYGIAHLDKIKTYLETA